MICYNDTYEVTGMKTKKALKWALVALLMSAMTFELLPGSVKYYEKASAAVSEATAYNFFTAQIVSTATACLPLAGVLTFILLVLALVAACFPKKGLYKILKWEA